MSLFDLSGLNYNNIFFFFDKFVIYFLKENFKKIAFTNF